MKKILLLLAVLASVFSAKAEDYILYTTSDGNILELNVWDFPSVFGANIVSNSYENGQGKILFDGEVQMIGDLAFIDLNTLTTIEIPNSVNLIGMEAFFGCSNLKSIDIPNSVSEIGLCAFMDCKSLESFSGKYASDDNRCLIDYGKLLAFAPAGLTSYNIPEYIYSIGMGAFGGCTELKSVLLPESLKYIDDLAFQGCKSLTSVKIPNSVSSIGSSAYDGCDNLISVEIPQSVSYIGSYAFLKCPKLSSFIGKFSSDDNRCLIVDSTLEAFAPAGLTSYSIPNSVSKIQDNVFENCRDLLSVEIPNSVNWIDSWAFENCTGLIEITSLNPTPPYAARYCFDGVNVSACVLKVVEGSEEAYKAHEVWGKFKNIVGIEDPNAINSVSATNFARTFNLQGVEVGDGYKGIVIKGGKKIVRK